MRGGDRSASPGRPRGRWHEPEPVTALDPRLPDVRRLEGLATRRARLADAASLSAKAAMAAATQALRDAEQALVDQVAYVASERVRLREERQAEAAAASALQTWRHREAQLMASIAPRQQAVGHCRHACDDAEVALFEALERQRSLNRRKEKYGLLIEQLADSGS